MHTPELLCLDATYKLLDLRLPIYLMLVEDSNGQSEIVAVCIYGLGLYFSTIDEITVQAHLGFTEKA